MEDSEIMDDLGGSKSKKKNKRDEWTMKKIRALYGNRTSTREL